MGSGELTLKVDFLKEKGRDWMGSSQALFQLEQDIIYEATGTNMVYPKPNSGKCITGRACMYVSYSLLTPFFPPLAEVPQS